VPEVDAGGREHDLVRGEGAAQSRQHQPAALKGVAGRQVDRGRVLDLAAGLEGQPAAVSQRVLPGAGRASLAAADLRARAGEVVDDLEDPG
jgi:hypothetical protein